VKRNGLSFDISAGVDNVFDVAYETLRAYAMPGRVYRVGLTMTYNQQPKNKSYEIELDSMPAR
jgi:hypothetical protein